MTRAFRGISANSELRRSYDALVVGAGIGGLVCANLLARDGLRVLLVEQHSAVGGYCSTFRRRGFIFDAASHFYPLLGNPATLTGKLLADLGIESGWVKMDPVDQFHFPDGSSFAVSADIDTYLRQLHAEFPEESSRLDEFFRIARQLYLWGMLEYFEGMTSSRLDRFRQLSLQDVLERSFRSPKLKLLLAADCPHWGAPPSRVSFVFDSMLRLSYFLGNYYPKGGSQAFADALALRFEQSGGQILLKTRVTRIVIENNRVTGAILECGRQRTTCRHTVAAETVVSNADLRQTVLNMLPHDSLESAYLARITSLRPTYPCFLSHIGVRGIPKETLSQVHGYHWRSWDAERVGSDAFHCKVFVPTLYEPSMAPPGCDVIIVQKVTDIDYEAIDDWPAHKQLLESGIFRHLQSLIPDLPQRIESHQSASAQTSHRFTLNYHGAMLGWEMAPDQLGDRRPDVQSPIDGLLYVGQWTRPGGGITPVIISAIRVAQRVTGNIARLALPSDMQSNKAPFNSILRARPFATAAEGVTP